MKIVISPAKSLNFTSDVPTIKFTEATYLKEAEVVMKKLKKFSPKELSELMSISDKLAALNWQRNQDWQLPFDVSNARQAVYAFDGDVYSGLDVYSLPLDKLDVLQQKLRILSGLYGILKPLDLMQEYRLEMGTKMAVGTKSNLPNYWKDKVTNSLNNEMKEGDFLINLASKEYFNAVDVKKIKAQIITPEFKDYKDGKFKMISFFAKKARGLMVRYIIDKNVETIDDLKQFDYEGYRFDANLSKENQLLFTR